jgi:hypothetical protein
MLKGKDQAVGVHVLTDYDLVLSAARDQLPLENTPTETAVAKGQEPRAPGSSA